MKSLLEMGIEENQDARAKKLDLVLLGRGACF